MAILSGDVKFVASRVMDDVPEGGGAPTDNQINDGASNEIFQDISEVDRAVGRVNMSKVFLQVETPDTDEFLGANVVVAQPPDDPNVSVTILGLSDFFAERTEAQTRLESYLAPGPLFAGYLFGNMLTGQRTVTLLQRENATLPGISDTLVLTKLQGSAGEYTQFVRITEVSSELRTFNDGGQDFVRRIVSLSISDSLRQDFPGFNATQRDPTFEEQALKTTVYESTVADAVNVYGTVALTEDASIGDFNITADGIYSRVVPSAQVEAPLADARSNQQADVAVPAGASLTQTFVAVWNPTQALYVGGSITPGTLTIVRGAVTITDNGGRLEQGASEVGTVDYDNGILSLSADVFGSSGGSHAITYTPAALQALTQRSVGIPITINNRSLSYVVNLIRPAKASLQVSYMVGGRWYVLRDDGSGAVRGSDSAFGVGNLNFTTGTLSLTLGALPDVGGALLLQYGEDSTALATANTSLRFNGKLYVPINTAGDISEEPGDRPIAPGKLVITWNDGAAKSATDNGAGLLTGDATGTVGYQNGVIRLVPNTLPPDDTVFVVKQEDSPGSAASGAVATVNNGVVWTDAAPERSAALGAAVAAGTISFAMSIYTRGTVTGLPANTVLHNSSYGTNETFASATVYVTDDGAGNLKALGGTVGTINYSTGALFLDPDLFDMSLVPFKPGQISVAKADTAGQGWSSIVGQLASLSGWTYVPASTVYYPSSTVVYVPGSASSTTIPTVTATVDRMYLAMQDMVANHLLQGVSFTLGTKNYRGTPAGLLITDLNPSTGAGTTVGTVTAATGVIEFVTWPSSTTNLVSNWRGVQNPPVGGADDLSGNTRVVFRTAAAPIRPGSFSFTATMLDGTPLSVTAATNGQINHPRVKGLVNLETGVVDLIFCNPSATNLGTFDASFLGISGVSTINLDLAQAETLRYNAVSYSYIPLDASIIGLDPVRLPSDGRVPIIRAGSVVVVGNTQTTSPATVSNGQTINLARERLSRAKVIGSDGNVINTGYTADLNAGTVTFTDVTGYAQPVKIEHRIEDMALVADAQINGDIRLTRPLTHDYPAVGTYVSSAMLLGDLSARTENLFDQGSWDGITWKDDLTGAAATGTFNDDLYPIVMTNAGAITERWALRFTSTTAGQIIGEHVGVIGTFSTNTTTAPNNPNTGVPYFTIPEAGWGVGWSVGNILRFNTIGAMAPVWLIRTIQQGPEAGIEYSFNLLARGDVDRP